MIKLIGLIIVGVAVIVGTASRYIFKRSDNIVEEVAEQVIKKQTGIDVDLSPESGDPGGDMEFVDDLLDLALPEEEKPSVEDKLNKQ